MIYWIANLIGIGCISFLFFKKMRGEFSPFIFWSGLTIKLAAGLSLGYIFSYYYSGGDSFLFFEVAKELISQPLKGYLSDIFTASNYSNTSKPRVLFFVKTLSPFVYLSGGSYWITSLYLSLISFLASWWMMLRLSKIYPLYSSVISICFLFVPSIVFWSSGILKDTITYSALLILVASAIGIHKKVKLSRIEIILAAISFFSLFKLKHYILITYILFIGMLFFLDFVSSSRVRSKFMALVVLFIAIFSTQFIHPYLNLKRLPLTIYENNKIILNETEKKDQLDIELSNPTWWSIIKETPDAIKAGLFRPSIFDHTPPIGWPHTIENLLLTFLAITSILLYMKEKPDIDISLALAAIFSILLMATLLALSTPNFGTLVRYKNAFMPFFFLLTTMLPYQYFNKERSE